MRSILRLMPVALALGLALGALFPSSAEATIGEVTIFNHQGGNGYLTCGWHTTSSGCGSGSGGALDWDNGDDAAVKWRSFTYNSSSSSAVVSATGDPVDASSTCYAVRVVVRDIWGVTTGSVDYKHTENDGSTFNIYGKLGWHWQESDTIGTSVDADMGGCAFGGSHVHQHSAGGFTTHNHDAPDYYPSASECELGVVETYCGTLADRHTFHYHMLEASFAY